MIGPTTVSSMRAVGPRGIVANMLKKTLGSTELAGKAGGKTQKSSGQDVTVNANKSQHSDLAKFREEMDEFTDESLRPETNLVGEKTYETSFSQAMKNLSKRNNGALTGFNNKAHGFAFGIMRPETGVVGEETNDGSNSMTLEDLSKEHIGAAAGIKEVLHKYAEAAAEKMGPLAAIVEKTKVFQQEGSDASAASAPQAIQHVDTKV